MTDLAHYPMVRLMWRDAWFDEAQEAMSRSEYLVQTVGFVVERTPLIISVAAEVLPDGDGFRAVTHIPRSLIIDERTLVPVVE